MSFSFSKPKPSPSSVITFNIFLDYKYNEIMKIYNDIKALYEVLLGLRDLHCNKKKITSFYSKTVGRIQYIQTTSTFLVEKSHLTMVILMIDTLQPIVCHLNNRHKLSPMTLCRTLPVDLRILLLLQQVGLGKLTNGQFQE